MEMKNTKQLLKFLFRFKCPKCEASSFEAKPMQDHLLTCKKDHLVLEEIKQEMNNITMVFENGNQTSQIGCADFEFEDSKFQTKEVKIDSVQIKQEPLENFDDENGNVQAPTEITIGPKIDTVLSQNEALDFHDNKAVKSTRVKNVCNPDLIRNQKDLKDCGKKFRSKAKKTRYNRTHTNDSLEKHYACEWKNCNKKFPTKQRRNNHFRTHTGDRPFSCDWQNCGKKFRFYSNKWRHYLTHTDEKPFACGWKNCTKKFHQKVNRDRHFKCHSGETLFACGWKNCNKKFSQKGNRDVHFRCHTGERLFACSWKNCNKKFTRKMNRDGHFRTHTGEEPYTCDWPNCEKKFARSQERIIHYRKHTDEKH